MAIGYWLALGAMVLAGISVATQAPINARLGNFAGGSMAAAMLSFGVGFLLLMIVVSLRGAMPSIEVLKTAPWWVWIGGALGAYYVWAATFSVPKLGVVTTVSALILGQLLGGLLLDAIGAFGLPVKAIDWQRVAAAGCVGLGVYLSVA